MGKEQLAKTEEQEGIQNELQSEETSQQQKRPGGWGLRGAGRSDFGMLAFFRFRRAVLFGCLGS